MGFIVFSLGATFLAWITHWAIRRGNDGAKKALWMVLPFVLIALTAAGISVESARRWSAAEPITSMAELESHETHSRVLVSGEMIGDENREWLWTSDDVRPSELDLRLEGGEIEVWSPLVEAGESVRIREFGLRRGATAVVFGTYWEADGQIGEASIYGTSLEDYRSKVTWFEMVPAAIAAAIAILGLFFVVAGFRHRKRRGEDPSQF